MYESMLREQTKARNDFLDGLVEKRNKGEVGKFVEGILNNGGCKSK